MNKTKLINKLTKKLDNYIYCIRKHDKISNKNKQSRDYCLKYLRYINKLIESETPRYLPRETCAV